MPAVQALQKGSNFTNRGKSETKSTEVNEMASALHKITTQRKVDPSFESENGSQPFANSLFSMPHPTKDKTAQDRMAIGPYTPIQKKEKL